jgi:CubicO group peptidase (beta-lactamase class C family)
MARFGLFTLHRGRWGDEQLLSDEWVAMALTPTPVREGYGFGNWYLMGEPDVCSVACGQSAFYHSGSGPNVIYVDPANDVVVVTRWIPRWRGVVDRVLAAIQDGQATEAQADTAAG